MMKDPINCESLKIVEESIFCLTLTDDDPESYTDQLWESLCGKAFDKWFDKSFNIIIHSNLKSAFNVEHSTSEATLTGRLWEYIYHHCNQFESDGSAKGTARFNVHVPVQPIKWNLENLQMKITEAEKDWKLLTADIDVCVYLTNKGKDNIKRLRVSPDGFIQMALQLAFYRLHHQTPKTYETAATRLAFVTSLRRHQSSC